MFTVCVVECEHAVSVVTCRVCRQVSEEVSVHAGGADAVSAAHKGRGGDAVLLRGRVDALQRGDPLSAARQSRGQLHTAVSHWSEFSRNQTRLSLF